MDPRLAVRVASLSAVCRTSMPPFSEDHATELFCRACTWPRHMHATHHGLGVGTPCERVTSHGGEDTGDVAGCRDKKNTSGQKNSIWDKIKNDKRDKKHIRDKVKK